MRLLLSTEWQVAALDSRWPESHTNKPLNCSAMFPWDQCWLPESSPLFIVTHSSGFQPSVPCFPCPPHLLSYAYAHLQFSRFLRRLREYLLNCFVRNTCAYKRKAGNTTGRHRTEERSQCVTCWCSAVPGSSGAPDPVPAVGSSPLWLWWEGCCSLCQVSSSSAGIQHPH